MCSQYAHNLTPNVLTILALCSQSYSQCACHSHNMLTIFVVFFQCKISLDTDLWDAEKDTDEDEDEDKEEHEQTTDKSDIWDPEKDADDDKDGDKDEDEQTTDKTDNNLEEDFEALLEDVDLLTSQNRKKAVVVGVGDEHDVITQVEVEQAEHNKPDSVADPVTHVETKNTDNEKPD